MLYNNLGLLLTDIFFIHTINENNRQNPDFQEATVLNASANPFTTKLSNYVQLGLVFLS